MAAVAKALGQAHATARERGRTVVTLAVVESESELVHVRVYVRVRLSGLDGGSTSTGLCVSFLHRLEGSLASDSPSMRRIRRIQLLMLLLLLPLLLLLWLHRPVLVALIPRLRVPTLIRPRLGVA